MNRKEKKELSLEVWRYLKDHPEVSEKNQLPKDLYSKIVDLDNKCPLCELYLNWIYDEDRNTVGAICDKECPLSKLNPDAKCGCVTENHSSPYEKWDYGDENDSATLIYNIIKEWDVGETVVVMEGVVLSELPRRDYNMMRSY